MCDLIHSTTDDHAEIELWDSHTWHVIPGFWTDYVEWVRINYQPHLMKLTIGQLVDAHLAEWGLTRIMEHGHCKIVGPPDSLTAWMLTYS